LGSEVEEHRMFIVLTAAAAVLGGLAAMRLKIPAGAMIGSLLAVMLLNLCTGQVYIPIWCKLITQTVAGAFIGFNMNRETVRQLKSLIAPAIFVAVYMQVQGILIGFLIHAISPIDLTTALLSAAPGGIVDMSLVSMDMGADTATVAVLHTVRLSFVILMFPQLIRIAFKRFGRPGELKKENNPPSPEEQTPQEAGPEITRRELLRWQARRIVPTGLVAAAGGAVGQLIGMPAGVILFSMVAVAAFSLGTHKAYLPVSLRKAAQMLAGALIGQGFGMEQVRQMRTLILPAVVIIAVYIICNLLAGLVIRRLFGLDLATGMFAASPGGVSDMALIASDLGAQSTGVAVLQIVRLVTVIAIYPQLVTLLTHLM